MLTRAVLHEGEGENQTDRPYAEQKDKRQRAEIAKHVFATRRSFDVPGDAGPGSPGGTVKPCRKPKVSVDAARQHHGLEGIEQDRQQKRNSGDGDQSVHGVSFKR